MKKILEWLYYGPLKMLPDELFLKLHYRYSIGRRLDLKNPTTFNEKLQWLKLNNRNPSYIQMVDKYEAKEYVKELIGEQYVNPSYGVWDSFDAIDFESLPSQFVLKCTHDSGSIIICKDKTTFDYGAARKKLNVAMKHNYFWIGREWPYKYVKPRILAETYIENVEGKSNGRESLDVYKVMTFNGIPKIIQTIQNDKMPNEAIDYFDTSWNLLDIRQDYPNSKKPLAKPARLFDMLDIAQKLSKGHPFLRVDFYVSHSGLLFSEFTFFSDNGFAKFSDEKWDTIMGNLIVL